MKRLVKEIRNVCPRPYCLSVKLNSADYMATGMGLSTDEGLEQVRWLVECGEVDFVEISGGNAENKTSKLHSKDTGHFLYMLFADFIFARFIWDKVARESPKEREHPNT